MEVKWFFPTKEDELKRIIKSLDKPVPHGGGTGLLRGDIRKYKAIVDLDKLDLSYIKNNNGFIEIGAMTTYDDIVRYFEKTDKNSILYKSLINAATTPLRNRITIGGSIAYFPPWSDILGPLFTLSAELYLVGEKEGWFTILDYVSNRALHRKTVITKIRYRRAKDTGYSAHFRATRTKVDHPAFTITLLLDIKDKEVDSASIYVVGTKDKYKRLSILEKQLIGKKVLDLKVESLSVDEVEFYGKPQFTSEYQRFLFEVEIRRLLNRIMESVK